MAKHSEGPWHYVATFNGDYEIRVASGGWLLRLQSASDPTQEQREEDEANVRLAASGPQLLKALKAMVHKATKQNWNDQYPDELNAAFDAIDAATGEQA